MPLTKTSSPGDSSQPASSEPSITVSAPAAIALAMSPEYCMPPSAITGTPAGRQATAASMIAVTCGTPTPATTRVVQIEPGPTPTLTASAPASTSAFAPAHGGDVAADDVDRDCRLEPRDHLEHPALVPVRGVDDDHVDAGVDQRHGPLVRVLADADRGADPQPARPRPWSRGNFLALGEVLDGDQARAAGRRRRRSAASRPCAAAAAPARRLAVTPTGAVTSGIAVMTSRTSRAESARSACPGWSRCRAGRRRRRRPARRRSGTGRTARRRVAIVSSGAQVIGLVIMPASDRLTMSTWSAWSSIERLRCSTPMPPWRAIAIAIRASVTVSIALDSSGVCSEIDRDRRVAVTASLGKTSDAAGSRSTSSKVNPSGANFAGIVGSMTTNFDKAWTRELSLCPVVAIAWTRARRRAPRPVRGRPFGSGCRAAGR